MTTPKRPSLLEMTARSDALVGDGVALEELLRDAQDVAGPADPDGPIVHEPTKEMPFGMTVEEIGEAGWKLVFDRFTGRPVPVLAYTLAQQLAKKNDKGEYVFTTRDPGFRPRKGKLPCFLHRSHPDRAHMDELGLPYCPAGNLQTMLDVRTHAQHTHKREWAILENERDERVREEERLVRQTLIRQARSAPKSEVYTGAKEATVSTETSVATTTSGPAEVSRSCKECGEVVTATSKRVIGARMMHHVRQSHPKSAPGP